METTNSKSNNKATIYLSVGAILMISLCLVAFTLQNATTVEVKLLFWQFSSSLGVLLICTALIGVLLPVLATLPSRWRNKKEKKATQERLNDLEKRLQAQLLKTQQLEATLLQEPAANNSSKA